MHHSATQNFHPACMLANSAAFPSANETTDVHFGTGFSKRNVRRTEAHLTISTKHFLSKVLKCLFPIGETYIFINIQTFYLMEKAMRPCDDCFTVVHPSGTNDMDRQFTFFHST